MTIRGNKIVSVLYFDKKGLSNERPFFLINYKEINKEIS